MCCVGKHGFAIHKICYKYLEEKNQHMISYRHNNCEIIYMLSEHMLVIDIRQTEQIAYYFVLVVTTKYTCVYNIYKLTSEYQIKQCQHHLKVNV